jgi:hypothetical protein
MGRARGARKVALGRTAILPSLIVVGSLNAIVFVGAAGHDIGAPPGLLAGLVLILDVSVLVSSILLGLFFARMKRPLLSALFLSNVALFIGAAGVRLHGFSFRPAVLFAVDLYWLNLYLVVLARHWDGIGNVGKIDCSDRSSEAVSRQTDSID